MKILHVTPHLGGGVGKAHAALRHALPERVQQTFVLLEEPRDRRYADSIESGGAQVITAAGLNHIAELSLAADIVQFEFWNHPRLFECLARCAFPAMRSVFWSHISGLSKPVIPPGLIEECDRFVFTTEASWTGCSVAKLATDARQKIRVINSGFGFFNIARAVRPSAVPPAIAYLGTVDFIKMHPGFFDAIDALGGDVRVSVWGDVDLSGPVVERARKMRHSGRIHFGGKASDPVRALSEADIFFYPLQRDHYGTAENALVEAMSLGLVPIVLNNPPEMAIVRDGETGLVAPSIEDCPALLQKLISSPDLRARMSQNAIRHVATTHAPAQSAEAFMDLWRNLLSAPVRRAQFQPAIGDAPVDWFLATQRLPGEVWEASRHTESDRAVKGMLPHFVSAFPHDTCWSRLIES